MHPITDLQAAALGLIFLAFFAACVYTFAFDHAPAQPLCPQAAQARADAYRDIDQAVASAIDDVWREYVTVTILGYTSTQARSHIRAYIIKRHDFLPDVRATIQRAAIARANAHLAVNPVHSVKDINPRPVYDLSARTITQDELDYYHAHGTVKGYRATA
jgi:hypothetical protein